MSPPDARAGARLRVATMFTGAGAIDYGCVARDARRRDRAGNAGNAARTPNERERRRRRIRRATTTTTTRTGREIGTTRGGWRAKTRRGARREPREDERATDETRIRDARATRLTRAGHEVTLQCERDERARAVLDARFQGVRRAREASEIEALPRDVDVLVCGLMTREYEVVARVVDERRRGGGA